MAKLYSVTFTVNVTEEVEANSPEEAKQAFRELFSSSDDLLEEEGNYEVTEQ